FHVVGMCIGGPYIMGLLRAVPQRFVSAVLLQPIGVDSNRQAFYDMFDAWAAELAAEHPEADDDVYEAFRSNMYDGDFMFNTTRDQVAAVQTPLLLFMGSDLYHPESTSREIAELAPNVEFVEQWKDDASLAATNETILSFLAART
ncbi:MAG: alpha/beta fold hydrolase, partial [Acidimicrobiales bacterium]